MLVVQCPGCGTRFKAKDELLGQTRKCPKCSDPILIEEGKTASKLVARPIADQAVTPPVPTPPPADETPVSEVSTAPSNVAETFVSEVSTAPSNIAEPPPAEPPATESEPADVGESDESKLNEYCRPIKKLNRTYRYLILGKDRITAYWKADGHGWILKTRFGNVSCRKSRDQIPAQGTFVLVEVIMLQTDEGVRLVGLRCFKLGTQRSLDALSKTDDMITSKIVGTGALLRDQKVAIRTSIHEQFMSIVWENATRVMEFLGNQDFHSCMIVEDDIDPSEV